MNTHDSTFFPRPLVKPPQLPPSHLGYTVQPVHWTQFCQALLPTPVAALYYEYLPQSQLGGVPVEAIQWKCP